MRTHISPTSQKRDLDNALRAYRMWCDWINSQVQPFTSRQLELIEVYRKTNSYAACSRHFNISLVDAANEITSIVMRLRLQLDDYERWEAGQRSLFDLLRIFDLQSINDLKAITVNDFKTLIGEPFKLAHRADFKQNPP